LCYRAVKYAQSRSRVVGVVVREGLSFRSQAALQLRAFRVIRGDETVEEMICKYVTVETFIGAEGSKD
jgi:hypothetical protein